MASLGLALMAALATTRTELSLALQYLALAAAADALAGRAAKGPGQSSDLGVELDSLATVLVWGVATALCIYQAGLVHLEGWGAPLAALAAVSVAWRLSKGDMQQSLPGYRGLPAQAAGLVLIGAAVLGASPKALAALVLALSALQIAPIPYPRIPARLWLVAPLFISLGLAALGQRWGWALPAGVAALYTLAAALRSARA